MSWYTMKDKSGQGLSDRLNIIFIDLATIRKKLHMPVNELTPVEKWGLFFSYVDKEDETDYISTIVRSDKGLMAAENTVKYMSEADANWFTQNSRYIYERDKNTLIHNAEQRGIQQGEQQKAEEIAKKMLLKKIPEQQISELTGLTVETILEIKKKISEKA